MRTAPVIISIMFAACINSHVAASDYIAIEEHLGSYLSSDLVFSSTDNKEIKILDMIDMPTVISPVYYNCPGLCTPIMDGMVKLMNRTDLVMGKDFQVINISFHEAETPELAAVKKRNYAELLNPEQNADHWHFMTGDQENIEKMLDELGYSVRRQGEDILHTAAIMIVSPSGKIVKYIHGTKYNPIEFKMAIQKAALEEPMSTISRALKACFNYEPAGRAKQRSVTILAFIIMISIAVIVTVAYPPLRNKN
jgi:protein SCO1/2